MNKKKTYRVIQWATGVVGKAALQHFIGNPIFELVGVLVTNPEKVGKDAGDLAGLPKTGVLATNDVEKIYALDADCVHYAPLVADVDVICRLLKVPVRTSPRSAVRSRPNGIRNSSKDRSGVPRGRRVVSRLRNPPRLLRRYPAADGGASHESDRSHPGHRVYR